MSIEMGRIRQMVEIFLVLFWGLDWSLGGVENVSKSKAFMNSGVLRVPFEF
jgi:hypothetical protein